MALNLDKIDLGGFGISNAQSEPDTRVRANMDEALKINPDQHAKTTNLSRKSGIPEFAVKSDPAKVEHGLKLDNIDFSGMSTRNPNTAKYLTDFNSSVIAQDDIDVLKSIEDIFSFSNNDEPGRLQSAFGSFLRGASSVVSSVPKSMATMFEEERRDTLEGIDAIIAGEKPKRPMRSLIKPREVVTALRDAESSGDTAKILELQTELDQLRNRASGMVSETMQQDELYQVGIAIDDAIKSAVDVNPEFNDEFFTSKVASGLGSGVAFIASAVVGKGALRGVGIPEAAATLTSVAGLGATSQYVAGFEDALNSGADFTTALHSAELNIPLGLTEAIPIANLFNRLDKGSGGLIKRSVINALKQGTEEAIQESFQTVMSNAIAQDLYDPKRGLWDGSVEGAEVGGVTGLVLGFLGTVIGGRRSLSGIDAVSQSEFAKETQGEVEQSKIDKLNEQSEKSKLRERDKESFKQFVEQTDGENNTNVFIDGAQTSLYLQSKTREEIEADPALTILAEQAREASELGGDVSIPVAEFAAEIAGTEHYAQLRDSMTMSDETASPFRQEQVKQETESYVKILMNEAQENASEYVDAQNIYESVRGQLIDSGTVTQANASIMAQVVPAWATAQAARQGKTVRQIYEDSGLVIEGPQTGEKARLEGEQVFLQEMTADALLNLATDTPRLDSKATDKLTKSIQKEGITKPAIVLKKLDGTMTLEDGHHRARIAKELGIDVPVKVIEQKENETELQVAARVLDAVDNAVFEQSPAEPVSLKDQGDVKLVETGKPVTFNFIHNTESATLLFGKPEKDSDFGRGFEPSGRFVNVTTKRNADEATGKFIGGTLTFKSPLVVANDNLKWKETLSKQYSNKTGKGLSKALIKEGFDGIITTEKGYISEVVDFTTFDEAKALYQKPNKTKEVRGYYDPANSIIRLAESADLSTFLHEFAHFMYEMEVKNGSDMVVSINNWYKRNADDVAKEANGYLGEKFDKLNQELTHRGGTVTEIKDDDVFGGVFTTPGYHSDSGVNLGNVQTTFEVEKVMGEGDSDIDYEKAYAFIKNRFPDASEGQLAALYEIIAEDRNVFEMDENPLSSYGFKDLGDASWEGQRLRGKLASHMGFDAVAMQDETGVSYLIPFDANYVILNTDTFFQFKQQKDKSTTKEGSITADDVKGFLDNGTTNNVAKDAAIRRAVHEQFARGFEAYLMEGKAPSVELRNAFRAFARWLSRIYQALRGDLNVKLDPEMTQVFDRLLATEEQIQAAQARARIEPMFTDATMAGMTEKEFADYKTRQETVKDVQAETLRDKIIKQLTRQTEAWWKEEKQDIIDEEIDILNTQKVYFTRSWLKGGDIKLDHATVKEMVGEDKVDKLGRKSRIVPVQLRGMTAKGQQGVHPDEAAAFFGYRSGSEMLNDLITAPDIKVQAEINAERQMIERHGDILTDGTIEREADEVVQDEERGELILHELKTLAKGTSIPVVDRDTIKALAADRISRLSFREIHPGKYRKAEVRAAQESARMLAARNKEGAVDAKTRQVMNYYLGMAATHAKNETVKIVDRMGRYNKKKVREEIQKSEGEYWDQLARILNRFEFRKSATLKEIESLNLWVKQRMEEVGDGLVLSNAVLNESYVTHWKNVPFSDLQGISDSVKNIEHVARYSNKMTKIQGEINFKKLKSNWVDNINKQDARFKTKSSRSRIDDARKATLKEHTQRWISQLTKIPFMASWLDGGDRVGLSHDILVQPFTDALDAKMKLVDDVATPVIRAIATRSKDDIKRHNRKIFIPAIDDNLSGDQVLAVALNTGNQGNLEKLLLGEGWANPENESEISFDNTKLQAVLSHMTKKDWELIQLVWDQMEVLYPQLAEVHRQTTGLVPPKVESTPIVTKFGTFKGGYYPVKYSPKRSHKAEKNAEKRDAETESMFNNTASIQASVNAGATNERTGFYDKIFLSLDVIPDHFNETIHYITHHDAVRQVNRLIQSPEVADAITSVLGEAEYKELRPWLNDIAKDGRQQPVKTFIDEAFNKLRFGTTLGVMGFKASTGIMQVFGLFTTAAELGVGPTTRGIQTVVGKSFYMKAILKTLGSTDDMQTGWDFAAERSKVLPHRAKTMDREIKNAMNRLSSKTGPLATLQEVSMKHIALVQTYIVDLPTWHAAYSKHLSENGDESLAVRFADSSVENLQGSGNVKDMARIMRNQSKIHSTFTMFMTFFSSLGNLTRDLVRGTRSGQYSITSAAAKTMFLFTLPVFFEMLMRGELNDKDDGDDERMNKFLINSALYPLTSVPFVRDIASGALSSFGYNSTPVAAMMERGITSGKGLVENLATDEEVTKSQVKNVSKLAGAAIGIPGLNQMWASGEHLYDVIEAGEEFTTRELLFGPDRK